MTQPAFPGDPQQLPTAEEVADQRIPIPVDWWNHVLRDAPGGLIEAGKEGISRADIWPLAAAARESADASARLLWHTLAWGAGYHLNNGRRRIKSVSDDPDRAGELLMKAADAARTDPVGAYRLLHPRGGRPALHGLGPTAGTKFLYFAGGGDAKHPCAILDSRVAAGLCKVVGGKPLPRRGWWPESYGYYCDLLGSWTAELSTKAKPVRADQIELWLSRQAGDPA